MLGPKHTAADVAVLLEEGLRDGTIDLFHSGRIDHLASSSRRVSARKAGTGARWLLFASTATLAVAIAVLVVIVSPLLLPSVASDQDGNTVHRQIELAACVLTALLGFHRLADIVGNFIRERQQKQRN